MEVFLVIVLALLLYLFPALLAIMRHHNNSAAIVALNILLGWSFLGWVVALVWAFTANTPQGKLGQVPDNGWTPKTDDMIDRYVQEAAQRSTPAAPIAQPTAKAAFGKR
jgi:hypothetical protein